MNFFNSRFIQTKIIRPLAWKAMRLLPNKIRNYLIRSFFSLSPKIPQELKFKLAETKEELEAAFALLHEQFVASQYMDKNSSGLRITKHHALPGTAVVIGTWKGEVICTMSIIHDGPLGLPIESTWNIDQQRKNAASIAEISALAISRKAQGRRGQILLPLCKFTYEYCMKYADVDILVISTLESVKDFYGAILLFGPLGDGRPRRYEFVKNVVAYAQFQDLRTAVDHYKNVYGNNAVEKNLHQFFFENDTNQFHFPKRLPGQCAYPVMTPELMDYFFNQKLSVFSLLSTEEKISLKNIYFDNSFGDVIQPQLSGVHARQEQRFAANLKGTLADIAKGRIQSITLTDISLMGFAAKLNERIELGATVVINIKTNESVLRIDAIVTWADPNLLRYGFQIARVSSSQWTNLIENIAQTYRSSETRILKKAKNN